MGKKKKSDIASVRDWEKYVQESVNEFDKEFKGNKKTEPEKLFKDTVDKMEDFLRVIIYEINGADETVYLSKKKKVKIIDSEEMMKKSNLCWYHPEYNIGMNSMIFRGRYLSLFLSEILHDFDRMATNQYKVLCDTNTGYYENSYMYLSGIIKDLKRFIMVFLSGEHYGNILLQIFQDCSYLTSTKSYPPMINRMVREITDNIKAGLYCKYGIYPMEMDEDIAIDSILKLAYMLVTGRNDIDKALPKFKKIEGKKASDNLRPLIINLGKAIDNTKFKNRHPMYLAFTHSDPLIMSKFKDINENLYVSNGVRALEYVKFFCDDPGVTRFVNRMLR